MTKDELAELLADCPTLYHMAEHGSWASILERGLLSTTALLDLYEIIGVERKDIEERRRPLSVALERTGLPRAVVRDQKPMDDGGLRRCLPSHLTPREWYRLLNAKVFFWLTEERLLRLLGASEYKDKKHDVLEIDSRALISAYHDRIWLCPINSGCTKPFPHPRDEGTFQRILDYPYAKWRRKRKRGERVVELAIDYAVPDLRKYVVRVREMTGDRAVRAIFSA